MNWRPTSGPAAARSRAGLLRRLRDRFAAQDVLEVDTPALSPAAVSDVHIESMTVDSQLHKAPLYLHTSPEFCMKRLLAAGYPDIYSIARVFRDSEKGRNHQPEFTLVEWYRLGLTLTAIIDDTVATVAAALDDDSLVGSLRTMNYRDAFIDACEVDPLHASIDDLAICANADADLRNALGDSRDDWLDLVLSTRVLPSFPTDRLTALCHYPASQAALARLCPDDNSVADRFEIFMGTTELANGYVELTDATQQAERFDRDLAARSKRGLPKRPVDQLLLGALRVGMPACAGVAMGLERLQMLHDGTDNIRDVITFAFEAYDD